MNDESSQLGPNSWLVDEMYETYRANPAAVDARWREYFENGAPAAPAEIGPGGSNGSHPASTPSGSA